MEVENKSLAEAMLEANRRIADMERAALAPRLDSPPEKPAAKSSFFDNMARLASIDSIMKDLQSRVDDLEDDFPEAEGAGGSGGGYAPYTSYFRVIDASGSDECIIGVTDGGTSTTGNCGAVKINGERVDVAAIAETVTTDGLYYVWIHSWVDSDGDAFAEIIIGTSTPPDNPNGGAGHASQLAGRVVVSGGVITGITQDYLRGGEHSELMFGDCYAEEYF